MYGQWRRGVFALALIPAGTAVLAQDCAESIADDVKLPVQKALDKLAACVVSQAALIADLKANPEGVAIQPSWPQGSVLLMSQKHSDDPTEPCPSGWSLFQGATGRMAIGAGQPKGKLSAEFTNEFGKYEIYDPKTGEMIKVPLRPHIQDNDGVWHYYRVMETGGSEAVVLSEPQMPRHEHDVLWNQQHSISLNDTAGDVAGDNQYRLDWFNSSERGRAGNNMKASWKGADQPHNNIPPYIALYFCKKD